MTHDADAAPDGEMPPDPTASGANGSKLLAFGAGLSLSIVMVAATAASIGVTLLVAFLGGVLFAMVMAGSRWATLAGFLVGILAWLSARGQLAPVSPSEWGGVGVALTAFLVLVVLTATGVGLRVGGVIRRPTADGGVARVLGLTGVAAVVGFVLTFAAAPAWNSFEIPLSGDWTIISRGELLWRETVNFGLDFTAVYKSTQVPTTFDNPAIGVTTVAGDGDPAACYRGMDTWARRPTPLYDGPLITRDTIVLPVGPAHLEVHSASDDAAGTVVYGYGIARSRRVGMLTEDLCYILAITVPPDAGISEEDVTAIAESFRFR